MQNSSRIAKNTIFLYIRMVIVMVINLFTVRIVLSALGQEDYGIYDVVAGFVSMLQGVSMVLSSSTQRFYSYALGTQDCSKLNLIFSSSLNIYILFSIIILLLSESIGLYFINNCLVIPDNRLQSANILYQFSVFSFVVTILQAPYSSAVIAHEDMGFFAGVSLVECLMKLIVAGIIYISNFDRLVLYGILLFLVPILVFLLYYVYARVKYVECRYKFLFDKQLHYDLLKFSGWSLFSSTAGVCMNQLLSILINVFFGPIVNASRAIATQVGNAINSYSSSFIMAVKAPMIKSYAQSNHEELNNLFQLSNKFIYFCMMAICIPLYMEIDFILDVWLGVSDLQTLIFAKLMIVYTVVYAFNNPISIIAQAVNKMKEYSVSVEIPTILCPIFVYLLFFLGYSAEFAFVIMIISIVIAHIIRIFIIRKIYKDFPIRDYLVKFIFPALFITFVLVSLPSLFTLPINNRVFHFVIVFLANLILLIVLSFFVLLQKKERNYLLMIINNKLVNHA